ncbi:MAG TPA: xanthine dehydrogenase family protein subunit M [Solirubrobacteraceae bacterium]|nr:xanthine dehydrogenase family protein subunit M [Solirubrobacteraceae bacterium]
MKPFAYERATDGSGAVSALAAGGGHAKYLGGGTNLIDLMKLEVETPELLVDVSRLAPVGVEETADGGLLIGAATRNSDLAVHPAVRERYPVLSRALLSGASGQLRNLATVGGNLLQRTRCPYFMEASKPCNKRRPGSGCPARAGHHRDLAILGHSEACVATHPSDMAVALAALGAQVHVTGPGGERTISMPGLHRLPGEEPERDTVLDPAELITAVALPALPFARRSDYRKARDRASFAFALVSVAAALDVAGGTVQEARIALGGVAHAPWRASAAEQALRGAPATGESFAAAADAELAQARPLRENGFKVPLARAMTVALLRDLAAQEAAA